MTPFEMQSLIEGKRAWLIPYLQGWVWKLDECSCGRFLHKKAKVREQMKAWVEILEKPDCTLEEVNTIEALIQAVVGEARRIYLDHLTTRDAEKELAAWKTVDEAERIRDEMNGIVIKAQAMKEKLNGLREEGNG